MTEHTLCDGYGFPKAVDEVCGPTSCTKETCCRTTPITCGEADILTGLCHGAVDYFKPCSGTGCNTATCCRPPLTCREAFKTGSVVCTSGVPAHLNEVSCPGGVCNEANCCKPVANCRDQNTKLNGTLCGRWQLNPTRPCNASLQFACNYTACCHSPSNCEESRPTCAIGDLFNEGAAQSLCTLECNATQCCRKPRHCGEAVLANQYFCGSLTFDLANLFTPCTTDCFATCCKSTTFSPTTAQPTTATPTPPTVPTAPTAPTNHPTPKPTTRAPTGGTTVNGGKAVSASVMLLGALLLCFAS